MGHKDYQTCWACSFSFIFGILWMTECKWGKGNFNTSQSVPCGALLVCCCHSCCLGGHEGHREPGGRRTGHHSLTSLKSISWQLAGGKAAMCNHQVPDHVTHIFRNLFSICSLPLLPGLNGLSPLEHRPAVLMHGATVLEGLEKSTLNWVTCALTWRPPDSPWSPWVTVNMRDQLLWHQYFHVCSCLYGTQSAHNAQSKYDFRNVKFVIMFGGSSPI